MQPPTTNPSSPTSNNASPDLVIAALQSATLRPFVSRIAQKSRRDGRQPRNNEVGRLSIEHRALFADLRALAGG